MAGNRIKGITIEIDGNTTPLNKSLKSVDASLKDTQTQLKDVNKLLKLDPSNVELLRQKQGLLTSAISDTKKRQEELKKALEQLKTAGDTEENRKQQDLLQRELIETTQSLKSMETELAGAGTATEKADKSTSVFAETLKSKLTGEAIIAGVKKLAKGLKELAMGAVELSDELATQAQVTGLSTDQLQEYNYMAELVDVSVDTITGSLTKLTRNMKSAQSGTGTAATAFQKLHVRVTNLDGSLRDNNDVFNDVLDALGNVANETERDALAMDIFGKSAQELNPLINAGSEQIRRYAKEAHDMGYVMSEDVIQKNVQASDAYERMQNSVQAAKNYIGSQFAPAIETAAGTIQNMIQAARDNEDVIKKLAGVLAGAVAGFVAYKVAVAAASAATALMAANPVTLCIAALTALAAAAALTSKSNIKLSEDTQKLIDKTDKLTAQIHSNAEAYKALEDSKEKSIAAANSEANYYTDLTKELETIVDVNGKVKTGYEDRAKVITGILSDALGVEIDLTGDQIKNYQQIQDEIYGVIEAKRSEAILKAQETAYTEAISNRTTAELSLVSAIAARDEALAALGKNQNDIKALEEEYQEIQRQGYRVMTDRQHAILDEIEALQGEQAALQQNVANTSAGLKEAQDTVANYTYNIEQYEKNLAATHDKEYGKINTVTASMVQEYRKATPEVKKQMEALYGDQLAEAALLYSASYKNGVQLVKGLRDGVNDKTATQEAIASVTHVSNQLLTASKKVLQIKSPSKATEQMGEYFIEGFGIGIADKARALYAEVATLGQNTLSSLRSAASGGYNTNAGIVAAGANTRAAAAGSGGVSVNVTVNGNVDNYDALAQTIGEKLQQQMARQARTWA